MARIHLETRSMPAMCTRLDRRSTRSMSLMLPSSWIGGRPIIMGLSILLPSLWRVLCMVLLRPRLVPNGILCFFSSGMRSSPFAFGFSANNSLASCVLVVLLCFALRLAMAVFSGFWVGWVSAVHFVFAVLAIFICYCTFFTFTVLSARPASRHITNARRYQTISCSAGFRPINRITPPCFCVDAL